jgi:hypothetical protein
MTASQQAAEKIVDDLLYAKANGKAADSYKLLHWTPAEEGFNYERRGLNVGFAKHQDLSKMYPEGIEFGGPRVLKRKRDTQSVDPGDAEGSEKPAKHPRLDNPEEPGSSGLE